MALQKNDFLTEAIFFNAPRFFFLLAIMGKHTCSDMETADESVQKDVQLQQHEEAQPKKKAKGLDLVSGGANCKQTSAVLCDLWHHSQVLTWRTVLHECCSSRDRQRQAVRGVWLGCADGGVEVVQDLRSKSESSHGSDRQDCHLHPRDAERISQKPKGSLRRYRVVHKMGYCWCGNTIL